MNSYVSLDYLKDRLSVTTTDATRDTHLRTLTEAVSRTIDRACNRHFFALTQARKFDGDGGLYLLIPDLISVTTVKTDDNKDRTFEVTWAATDYLLLPSNADPTTRFNPLSRPYTEVWVDVDAGTEDVWTLGHETVEIAAEWGYWKHLARATSKVNRVENHIAADTCIQVDDRDEFEVGQTILIGSEQLYIVNKDTVSKLGVIRGVNGTTAAAIYNNATIDIYEYPGPIREATIEMTSRLWKRKDSAFANEIGFPDGTMAIFKGIDPDVAMQLGSYVKLAVGVGV